MTKLKAKFSENLVQFELAKLKSKYEKLGFNFREDCRMIRKGKQFLFDAYAKHPETKEEIIFEIKALETFPKKSKESILKQREEYLKYFPNSKFILVVARLQKLPEISKSSINLLLQNFISEHYTKKLKSEVFNFMRVDSVTDISYDKIDFGNFSLMNLEGYANLKFWIKQDNPTFKGESLADGIPFQYHIELIHNSSNSNSYYSLSPKSVIYFDLSEFNG